MTYQNVAGSFVSRRRFLVAAMAGTACTAAPLAIPSALAGGKDGGPSEWHKEFTSADPTDSLELVIPLYEGLNITKPTVSLPDVGFANFELAYPGPLSAPCVAWRFGDGEWTAVFADSLAPDPVSLAVATNKGTLSLTLKSFSARAFQSFQMKGSWENLAAALRSRWNVSRRHVRLADRFDRINFYVHQWVANENPPLRLNWTVDQLVVEMKGLKPTTLVQLYGIDPGGIDLGARYFWADRAEGKARKIIAANPRISHLSWLNLRTYKTSIPQLRRELPITAIVRDMARQDRSGMMTEHGAFDAVDMCLACEAWQVSRLKEFDHLVNVGFKVIQLDEFPIPPVWHVSPCMARGHLHDPGDVVGEWSEIAKFLAELSRRAETAGVTLTCEEPSAALLPFVSGYIDRQFNDKIDLYKPWRKSSAIQTIPLFSTVFREVCTPYTDADEADPARMAPKDWIKAHEVYPPATRQRL